MKKISSKLPLLSASSVLAISASMGIPAFAQDNGIEQVVVSASRITIAGYQQPTPVSVIGAAALAEAANTDIGDTLRQMPSMGAGASPEKGAAANGLNTGQAGILRIGNLQIPDCAQILGTCDVGGETGDVIGLRGLRDRCGEQQANHSQDFRQFRAFHVSRPISPLLEPGRPRLSWHRVIAHNTVRAL